MTRAQMAAQIPDYVREKLLSDDIISKVKNSPSDPALILLYTLWGQYVVPGDKQDINSCGKCRANMIDNWKSLQVELINVQKAKNLIKAI